MGSPTPQNTAIMLTMIPFMWISKLRHLRILSKIGLHLTLQSLPTLDFLLPLFSAPYQVMAHEHTKWFEDEEDMSLEELEAKMMKDEDGADENQADEEADEEENEEEGDEEAEEEEGADEEEANEEEGEDEEDEE